MYKCIVILSVIILIALCGLGWLGYHSIQMQENGMEGVRLGEFAEVAEQIRQDIKRKLDDFMQAEQNRPYTDYQYYYVPENALANQHQMPVLRSPLSKSIENNLAYGNFQVDSSGLIMMPYDLPEQKSDTELSKEIEGNRQNIKNNLLPALNISADVIKRGNAQLATKQEQESLGQQKSAKIEPSNQQQYKIQSLQKGAKKEQIIRQSRLLFENNIASNAAPANNEQNQRNRALPDQSPAQQVAAQQQEDFVQIRIEPFSPLVVPAEDTDSIFGGQIFMLRHVQIEDRHLIQGFELNQKKLAHEIEDSARRLMRDGMDFQLSKHQSQDAAFAAILDFGFGNLTLNLKETDPAWITNQIRKLQNWYFGIVAVVLLAVSAGLVSLWRNARAQLKLAQKKDDFISAVSHELRTPLTSIRMHAEMLEENWVKSPEKSAEYYKNMRQESERLSRLIENVLDFSRIQKKRKKYFFQLGDINKCILDVVEMMRPFASQNGFVIKTELGQLDQSVFDSDAVTQIVINLLDNTVKYARNADDKTITVRTEKQDNYTLIEVHDHGPGIPNRQKKKVFEEFYRIGSESTRETTGTGLGLALVKKFAEAHNGFVEILNSKPTGALLRVGLAL